MKPVLVYSLKILLLFEIVFFVTLIIFINSQFRKGLDKKLCKHCESSKNQMADFRIVNGTKLNSWSEALPWISFLITESEFTVNKSILFDFVCTSSILNSHFALTAQHCIILPLITDILFFTAQLKIKNYYVGTGLTELDEITSDSPFLKKLKHFYLPPELVKIDYDL